MKTGGRRLDIPTNESLKAKASQGVEVNEESSGFNQVILGANDNNGSKSGSPPVNIHGVATRTRRSKDKMNGFVHKHSGYRCSCCDLNAPKEKDGAYLNKASSGYEQGKANEVQQANVDPQSPGKGLKSSSPTLKRALWEIQR
eukprot:Gb_06803 [translate_table: standard]